MAKKFIRWLLVSLFGLSTVVAYFTFGGTTDEANPQHWPGGKLYRVPEWKGITTYLRNIDGTLDDYAGEHCTIDVVATELSFERYLNTLRDEKFAVTVSDEVIHKRTRPGGATPMDGCDIIAERDLVRIGFTRLPDHENGYRVTFELANPGRWPHKDLPDFMVRYEATLDRPTTPFKSFAEDPVLYKPGVDRGDGDVVSSVASDRYDLKFTLSGLSRDEAVAYMRNITSRLTNGQYSEGLELHRGFGIILGACAWNKKNYNVRGVVAQVDDNTFAFSFDWSAAGM